MRPLHADLKMLSRCPCCAGKYHKRNAPISGKKAARANAKRILKKEVDNE